MRLVDFLICILEAHAGTLQRLAALYGEEMLLEMLESYGEGQDPAQVPRPPNPIWFGKPVGRGVNSYASAYAELEHAVHEFHLPATLEFHVWAYPHYRAFIESPLDLNSPIGGAGSQGSDTALTLVDEALAQAKAWIKKFPIPPELGRQTESAALTPWLRFRTSVLRRTGGRPINPVMSHPTPPGKSE